MPLLRSSVPLIHSRSAPLYLPRWAYFIVLACSVAFFSTALIVGTYHLLALPTLLPLLIAALSLALLLSILSLMSVRNQQDDADRAFRNTDCELFSIFQNVLDAILIVDEEGCCLDANPAASGLLQMPIDALIGRHISRFLVSPTAFTRAWWSLLPRKNHQGRAQVATNDSRDLLVDFTAAPDYLPGRHILILCDVTERTRAELSLQRSEEKISEQRKLVDAARAEAEALRKATLALSRNLTMDSVLDTLLECISELIPYDVGTVLFVEEGADLLVARESPRVAQQRTGLTLASSENIFLQRVLFQKQALLLPDLAKHAEWRDIQPFDRIQSWLGVPLIAGGRVLGILSVGAYVASTLTYEHLRLAKSLAIPAAVAIENARVHERAEIYATELALRLEELRNAQNALGQKSRDGCC